MGYLSKPKEQFVPAPCWLKIGSGVKSALYIWMMTVDELGKALPPTTPPETMVFCRGFYTYLGPFTGCLNIGPPTELNLFQSFVRMSSPVAHQHARQQFWLNSWEVFLRVPHEDRTVNWSNIQTWAISHYFTFWGPPIKISWGIHIPNVSHYWFVTDQLPGMLDAFFARKGIDRSIMIHDIFTRIGVCQPKDFPEGP